MSETRTCQNCKQDFVLEPDDIGFLENLKLPKPSLCPRCQLQRRLVFRNERSIYKRKCAAPGHTEELISNYSPDKAETVYDLKYWWGDAWDPTDYGQEYDFNRPFFEQFRELAKKVPVPSLVLYNAVNSDYCNFTTDNKNCYLVFGGDFNEDCMYSTFNFYSRDTSDAYFVDKCELCYEIMDSESCYKVKFAARAENCSDCMFLFDCVGCTNCVGCVGLKNKSHHILNQPYSKEEYEKHLGELKLDTRQGLAEFREKFRRLEVNMPHRYAYIFKSTGSTGDNIINAKNAINSFDISGPAEELKNVLLAGWGIKDAHNMDHCGHKTELVYDGMGIFDNSTKIFYSVLTSTSRDVWYSWNCRGSSDLFGCVNLKNRQYCILNRQYSKEEYEALVPKIKEQMDKATFSSLSGKKYGFGEFFPPELSPFGYNETIANEFFPLGKDAALAYSGKWMETEEKTHTADMPAEEIPASIRQTDEGILQSTLACAHSGACNERCTKAFKLIPAELQLYRRLGVPVPQLCPNCRHYQRIKRRNPIELWNRTCMCAGTESASGLHKNTAPHHHGARACGTSFNTTYAPDRPETVYCEQCYQAEIA